MRYSQCSVILCCLGTLVSAGGCASPQTTPRTGTATNAGGVDAVLRQADARLFAGNIDQGVAEVDAALASIRSTKVGTVDEARLLSARGRLLTFRAFLRNAGIGEALTSLDQAIAIASAPAATEVLARARLRRAAAAYVQEYLGGGGQYEPLVAEFEAAERLATDVGDHRGVAEAVFYLGLMQERLANPNGALVHYRRSLRIAQEFGYKLEASFAVRHIGFVLQGQGDLEAAHEHLATSLALREEIGFRVYLPFSYLSMGAIAEARGQYDAALEHYQKARVWAKQLSYGRVLVLCDLSAGDAHREKSQMSRARELFRRAEQGAAAVGFNRGVRLARQRLGQLDQDDSPPR